MSVCMNRIGAPSSSLSGGVDAVMGSIAPRNSPTVVVGAMGPAPEDPTRVICGGIIRASFGSKRRWTSSTRAASDG